MAQRVYINHEAVPASAIDQHIHVGILIKINSDGHKTPAFSALLRTDTKDHLRFHKSSRPKHEN